MHLIRMCRLRRSAPAAARCIPRLDGVITNAHVRKSLTSRPRRSTFRLRIPFGGWTLRIHTYTFDLVSCGLAVLAVFAVSCNPAPVGVDVLPLTLFVDAPTLTAGDTVAVFRLRVVNESNDTVRFVTQVDDAAFRVFVRDAKGTPVWDSQLLTVRTEPNNLISIPGRATRAFVATWDIRSNGGVRVPAGTYQLTGEVAEAATAVSPTGLGRPLNLRTAPLNFLVPG